MEVFPVFIEYQTSASMLENKWFCPSESEGGVNRGEEGG